MFVYDKKTTLLLDKDKCLKNIDLMQLSIGSCTHEQIAVALSCPVVAIHKERLNYPSFGPIYGQAVEKQEGGWGRPIPGMYVKSLSQEHGVISASKTLINNYRIGDCIIVLPVHSCMTVHSMKSYKLG